MFDLEIWAERREKFEEELKRNWQKKGKKGQIKLIFTPNPEQIVLAGKDAEFKRYLQAADYLIPDGAGVVWASKYLRKKRRLDKKAQKQEIEGEDETIIAERITGADMTAWILEEAERQKMTVLVLGGFYANFVVNGDIANIPFDITDDSKIGLIRRIRMKNGMITNWLEGYQNIKKMTKNETEAVKQAIKQLKPDILLVAFGAPTQEKWLIENRAFLSEIGVKTGMSIGGSVDFLTGKVRRAPKRWQKWGLEWLFRLGRQPWRAKRQMALIEFLELLAKHP